jgi:hypothetical protein
MNETDSVNRVDSISKGSLWLRRGLQFVVIPLLWLFCFRLSALFGVSWLALLGLYIILLSACGIMNLPYRSGGGKTRTLLGIIGPIVWGGFIAVLYALLYLLIFEFDMR